MIILLANPKGTQYRTMVWGAGRESAGRWKDDWVQNRVRTARFNGGSQSWGEDRACGIWSYSARPCDAELRVAVSSPPEGCVASSFRLHARADVAPSAGTGQRSSGGVSLPQVRGLCPTFHSYPRGTEKCLSLLQQSHRGLTNGAEKITEHINYNGYWRMPWMWATFWP